MLFCIHCGAKNHENSRFCTSCGKPMGPPAIRSEVPSPETARNPVKPPEIRVPDPKLPTPAPKPKKRHLSLWAGVLLLALLGIVSSIAIPALLGQRARHRSGSVEAVITSPLATSATTPASPLDEAEASAIVLAGIKKKNDTIASLAISRITQGSFSNQGATEALVSISSPDFINAEGLNHVYLLRRSGGAWSFVDHVAQGEVQQTRPHEANGVLDVYIGETGMQNGQTYTFGQWFSLFGFPATPARALSTPGRS